MYMLILSLRGGTDVGKHTQMNEQTEGHNSPNTELETLYSYYIKVQWILIS